MGFAYCSMVLFWALAGSHLLVIYWLVVKIRCFFLTLQELLISWHQIDLHIFSTFPYNLSRLQYFGTNNRFSAVVKYLKFGVIQKEKFVDCLNIS